MSSRAIAPQHDVPLAPRCTLGVGGNARFYFEAESDEEIASALAWARERALAVEVLGGGSNVLIADGGLDALVLRVRAAAIRRLNDGEVDVDAGSAWDALVRWSVEQDLAGLECLSGIPGDVGAAPIQNVGAYGQEISETLVQVEAIDRQTGARAIMDRAGCGLTYRDSIFKHEADSRYVICRARFRLTPGGAPKVAYSELERALGTGSRDLARVRATVIALRRAKSMVLDPDDENRRSAGSFFVNPTVAEGELEEVRRRAAALAPGEVMPEHPAPAARIKLSAAWLIERAGMRKGTVRGRVGISTRHSLALVNRGGATAAELLAFADEVRALVQERFGVALVLEPRLLGFDGAQGGARQLPS